MSDHADVAVEVRSVDDSQRLATLLVCRYGEISRRTQRPERFLPGAFTKSVTRKGDRIPFTTEHTGGTGKFRAPAVARPVAWDVSDPAELRATVKFFDSSEGWNAYCRARDGEIDAGSVGFQPIEERTTDGVREIGEAVMHHFALLSRQEAVPAYDAPRVLEVRQADEIERLLAVTWDHVDPDACVDMAEMRKLVSG